MLILPLPPALNAMLRLAKGWRRGPRIPGLAYRLERDRYYRAARACLPPRPLSAPWPAWELIEAHFVIRGRRDPVELAAGLKWPIDLLVLDGYLAGDSTRECRSLAAPTWAPTAGQPPHLRLRLRCVQAAKAPAPR